MLNIPLMVLDRPLTRPAALQTRPNAKSSLSGNILILEDDFIIAMDLEELVTELGATTVYVTNNCAEALDIIDRVTVTAAILDFDVEDGTSERVADALVQNAIPFIFTTGHSDNDLFPERYQHHPILKKPYSRDEIVANFQINDPGFN